MLYLATILCLDLHGGFILTWLLSPGGWVYTCTATGRAGDPHLSGASSWQSNILVFLPPPSMLWRVLATRLAKIFSASESRWEAHSEVKVTGSAICGLSAVRANMFLNCGRRSQKHVSIEAAVFFRYGLLCDLKGPYSESL